VITAAEQLLVSHGYARASTNLIAKRAGVSVGSLYQYFNNKEAVFRAVIQHHREQVMPPIQRAMEAMSDAKRDLVPLILELMRELSRVNAGNAELMTAIDRELNWLDHETDDEIDVAGHVRQLLRDRYAMPERELTVTSELMMLTVSQLSRWLVHSKPTHIDAEAFIAATGRMLQALLVAPRRQARR
jgi:AcrR family transcriptional regulator